MHFANSSSLLADGTLIFSDTEKQWRDAKLACQNLGIRLAVNPSDTDILAGASRWGFCGHVNTLRPRQNGCHFPDDIFKCIFLNENV